MQVPCLPQVGPPICTKNTSSLGSKFTSRALLVKSWTSRVEICTCHNLFDNMPPSPTPRNPSKDRLPKPSICQLTNHSQNACHLTDEILEYMSPFISSILQIHCHLPSYDRPREFVALSSLGTRLEEALGSLGKIQLRMRGSMWWVCMEGVLVKASKVSKLFALVVCL